MLLRCGTYASAHWAISDRGAVAAGFARVHLSVMGYCEWPHECRPWVTARALLLPFC